ncbi:MAG: RimK family protein [Desulfobulbaceae bacterium]|nr:RimK family protein [Desulfobulbaceae bacterium]
MIKQIIVVESLRSWADCKPDCPVVHVDDYLTNAEYFRMRGVQVINLCRSYRYLSVGYYCSLLAEARRHRVIPSVKTQLDLSSRTMYNLEVPHLDEVVRKSFKKKGAHDHDEEFSINAYFGQCFCDSLNDLMRRVFESFPCPVLRVTFSREKKWRIIEVKPLAIERLEREDKDLFYLALEGYLKKRWRPQREPKAYRFDLAILHDPEDELPPSNEQALKNFIKAGKKLGIHVDLIVRKDYSRLAEYDGLFIRDTTSIKHYTYRFAKKAESEGMVVIDDPQSILRCANKVYLAELLSANRIPTPKTVIVGKHDLEAAEAALGYPLVVKLPDGAFSQGVFKVDDGEQFRDVAGRLFKHSELILAQEFFYTDFDWRIGILNKKPLFACKYFMSGQHWQILHYTGDGKHSEGEAATLAVEDAPPEVVRMALKATSLIGDGLYGVDLKQKADQVFIIEVNDNPNIDRGVEDRVLKSRLYELVMAEFLRRMENRRRLHSPSLPRSRSSEVA